MFAKKVADKELKEALAALNVKLTNKQMQLFAEQSNYLLTGPTYIYQGRLVPYLKRKGLIEEETFTNTVEILERLTPKGREVALLFGKPMVPADAVKEKKKELEENPSGRIKRYEISYMSADLKDYQNILKWHALDCFEYQGGKIDAETNREIRAARRKIVEGKTFAHVPKWPRWMSDSYMLDGIVNVKAYLFPRIGKYTASQYQGSAKRMREYAIDRRYETTPKKEWGELNESRLCHWQGMQLIHLCDLWASCGERTFELLLDGTCPMPARFDE